MTGRTTDIEKLGCPSKVLLRKTGKSIIAAYDDSGRYPEQSLYFTFGEMSEDPFYILGLLNSRLMNFLYFHTAITNRDSIAQVKKVDLDALPVAIHGHGNGHDKKISMIAAKAREIHDGYKAMHGSKTDQERALNVRRINLAEAAIEGYVGGLFDLSIAHCNHIATWDLVEDAHG